MIRYDPTVVDLTSNFFVLCTNLKVYLYDVEFIVRLSYKCLNSGNITVHQTMLMNAGGMLETFIFALAGVTALFLSLSHYLFVLLVL